MQINDDLENLNGIFFKLETFAGWGLARKDIREVGRIRKDHNLAKQRDDETYTVFLARLIATLEGQAAPETTDDTQIA